MTIAQRRREERERRRQQIIDAAEAVFGRRGFDRATMGDIAREARLSRGLLYVYFQDKDDLYLAITLRALGMLRDRYHEFGALEPRGLEKIVAMCRAYVRFAAERPLHFGALSHFEVQGALAEEPVGHTAECLELRGELHEAMTEAIRSGVEDGSIRSGLGDPMATAMTLWSFTHGLTQFLVGNASAMASRHGVSRSRLREHALQLMLGSLAVDGGITVGKVDVSRAAG